MWDISQNVLESSHSDIAPKNSQCDEEIWIKVLTWIQVHPEQRGSGHGWDRYPDGWEDGPAAGLDVRQVDHEGAKSGSAVFDVLLFVFVLLGLDT